MSLKSFSLWPVFSKIIFSKTYFLHYVKKIWFNKVIEKIWYVTSFFQNNNFVQYSHRTFLICDQLLWKNSLRSSSKLKKLMIWFLSLPFELVWIFLASCILRFFLPRQIWFSLLHKIISKWDEIGSTPWIMGSI